MGSIDLSVLNSWYAAQAGVTTSNTTLSTTVGFDNAGAAAQLLGGGTVTAGASSSIPTGPAAPAPPWLTAHTGASSSSGPGGIPAQTNALMQSLLAGNKLINPSAAKLSGAGTDPNAAANYRNLFALYQGLTGLQSIAKAATSQTLTASQTQQLQKAFQAGMQQLQTYVGSQPFDGFQIYQTKPETSATTSTAIPVTDETYVTRPLYQGAPNGEVPGFQGDVQFSLTATRASGSQVTVNFDFSQMGAEPRTFGNVLSYMNGQMAAAGLATRFGESFTAGTAKTEKVGSKTITLPPSPNQYSLKVLGSSAESLTFQAPTTNPAVYVGQSSGITAATAATGTTPDAVQQLVKFDAASTPADATETNGQAFSQPLGASVSKVVATATSSDGSVYTLADVTGSINGQAIQGSQDVALIKYDSAGNVVFTQTLGANTSASGYGLAVSADGSQVAVVGSTADNLNATTSSTPALGASGATPPPQGFVTVYDSSGNEAWTQQTQSIGGTGTGVQPSSVAFGANGMVYVAGQVDGSIPGGGGSSGGLDAYVQAFHATSVPLHDGTGDSQWVVTPTAAVQYGTTGQDHATGIAVSGSSIYVSSLENGSAVVRQFAASGTTGTGLVQSASLDLGSVQGGAVAGVAVNSDGSVIVAGSTHNGALNGGTITQAYSGGEEAFVASLSADLQPGTLTYLGGSGDQTASAVTVSNGQVYVAGQVSTATVPGLGETSAWNGYVAAVDPTTGQTTWTQQYSGAEHEVAPASIAVAQTGASVLDQLGLPGVIDTTPSQELVTDTSLRPGDQFFIQSGTGRPAAVTIAANDTYQTLSQKIARASNYELKVTVVPGTSGNTLKLAPAFGDTQVSILPGPSGRDALAALGLSQGTLTNAASKESSPSSSSTSGPPTRHNSLKNGYSLNLSSLTSLSSPAKATAAGAALSLAISAVKSIYTDMTTAPAVGAGSSSGKVPTYLTNEIANYQAALARLTGA
jgi:hypothetical protein